MIISFKIDFLKPEPIVNYKSPKKPKKEPVERLGKKFIPFDVYFEKHRSNFNQVDSTKGRNEARSIFKYFSDKKKLKYIKKAETNYEEHYVR